MSAQWIEPFVGRMHVSKVRNKQLASHMKCSENWVSDVLNGKRSAKDSELKFTQALEEIIKKRGS